MKRRVVFWQTVLTPHMLYLAEELTGYGCDVSFVSHDEMTSDRLQQGWSPAEPRSVDCDVARSRTDVSRVIQRCGVHAVHIVQGLRRNGFMEYVRSELKRTGATWGAVMEGVDVRFGASILKGCLYRLAVLRRQNQPRFVLAIGEGTREWISGRGYPASRVFPFAYFISPHQHHLQGSGRKGRSRIVFVGSNIPLKRLSMLVDVLCEIRYLSFEFVAIGAGTEVGRSIDKAVQILGRDRVEVHGAVPMERARAIMSSCDLLVLPSSHDGWGVVASEALVAGVAVICSDRCGCRGVVRASGVGGVFDAESRQSLLGLVRREILLGQRPAVERSRIAEWAECLTAPAGAGYLVDLLKHVVDGVACPRPPWIEGPTSGSA